jgi:hypothetical protein
VSNCKCSEETARPGLFAGLGLKDLMWLLLILMSTAGAFSSVKAELQNDCDRIVTLERNVVPRAEQEAREAERARREQEWNQRLDRIEGKLDELIVRKSR